MLRHSCKLPFHFQVAHQARRPRANMNGPPLVHITIHSQHLHSTAARQSIDRTDGACGRLQSRNYMVGTFSNQSSYIANFVVVLITKGIQNKRPLACQGEVDSRVNHPRLYELTSTHKICILGCTGGIVRS
jgi:hypothetical protein